METGRKGREEKMDLKRIKIYGVHVSTFHKEHKHYILLTCTDIKSLFSVKILLGVYIALLWKPFILS